MASSPIATNLFNIICDAINDGQEHYLAYVNSKGFIFVFATALHGDTLAGVNVVGTSVAIVPYEGWLANGLRLLWPLNDCDCIDGVVNTVLLMLSRHRMHEVQKGFTHV
jgi:hypothetical protein